VTPTSTPEIDDYEISVPTATPKTNGTIDRAENSNDNTTMYPLIIGLGALFLLIVIVYIKYKRNKK
jgi:hypothetical protein